jgi:hypothetical protein
MTVGVRLRTMGVIGYTACETSRRSPPRVLSGRRRLFAGVAAARRAAPCACAVERVTRGNTRLAATTCAGRLADCACRELLAIIVCAAGRAARVVATDARLGLDRPYARADPAGILPAWLILDAADQVGWAHEVADYHLRPDPHLRESEAGGYDRRDIGELDASLDDGTPGR